MKNIKMTVIKLKKNRPKMNKNPRNYEYILTKCKQKYHGKLGAETREYSINQEDLF